MLKDGVEMICGDIFAGVGGEETFEWREDKERHVEGI